MKSDKLNVSINAPQFKTLVLEIVGTTPYCQNRFSKEAMDKMIKKHEAGSTERGKKVRDKKDFDRLCEAAIHRSRTGWAGIPASAFRNAMISACRIVGFKMTHAKLAVFVEADGFDVVDSVPLVKITKGKPERQDHMTRNATGVVDIRPRPFWKEGWRAILRIRYDSDMLTATDIANLLMRVGTQVGIGEGRPDSKDSAGMGWGLFTLIKGNK